MLHALIIWFTKNHVAANLLMVLILALGFHSLLTKIPLEVFPFISSNTVIINVAYRGATPAEVEESISIRIEEAIQDLEGIEDISSRSVEGLSRTVVEVDKLYDIREVMDDIKSRVDAINTFPQEAERPVISESQSLREVISVVVSGDISERELRFLGETVRDDILRIPGITQVELEGVRPYEISIEIQEHVLREYNLTLAQVALQIANASLDLSAGNIKTRGGDILIRTKGQAYSQREFEKIAVIVRDDGTRLLLGDIAIVKDGFEEEPLINRFNNERAVLIEVYRVGKQSAIDIADKVKAYIEQQSINMPESTAINYWRDRSRVVELRLETLTNSALQGGILVMLLLTLFLRPGVAFWVCFGIPVSFMGAFIFIPEVDGTLNLISMFAFILVLGIVVDDAIVTGESIYTQLNKMDDPEQAAIQGSLDVAIPVTFGVLTTVAAFLPLLLVDGRRGEIFANIPMVVVPVLLFSLIETKLILPSHLKHMRTRKELDKAPNLITRLQQGVADGLEKVVAKWYGPFLRKTLERRYLALACVFGIIIIVVASVMSGWTRFIFFPRVQSEVARAKLNMPVGTPFEVTDRYIEKMVVEAQALQNKYFDDQIGQSVITNILATTGSTGGSGGGNANVGRVWFEIIPPEERRLKVTSAELVREWRQNIGIIPGADRISFRAELGHGGDALDFQLTGQSYDQLQAVSEFMKMHLNTYPGVFDISDSLAGGKQELRLKIKPEAEALGLTLSDLARQVRQAFFGFEVQRIQRGRDDVRVMVRYPAEERRSVANLQNMYIRTADGSEVPFTDVAEINPGTSPAIIYRIDRQRVLNITADVNKDTANVEAIKAEASEYLQQLLTRYPGIRFTLEGEAKEQSESLTSLLFGVGFVLFVIYALLAIPFKSYAQPLVVMSVIPVGAIGALMGHWIMGMPLTIMSLMGMLALAGVVVNDSLVLVDYINKRRMAGYETMESVLSAGMARFRPVLLTSLTTFVGLMPIIFEKSTQAQFLIPMAVSLGFGILFATFITLLVVPANYVIMQDIAKMWPFGKKPTLEEVSNSTQLEEAR